MNSIPPNYHIVYYSVREVLTPRCSQQWFDNAMVHLKRGDPDAWKVEMYGA